MQAALWVAMWTMKYDMWCKMHFFGEQMHQQMAGEVVRTRGPKNMLDMLSDDFTYEDAQAVRIRERKKNSNPMMQPKPMMAIAPRTPKRRQLLSFCCRARCSTDFAISPRARRGGAACRSSATEPRNI